MAERFYFTIASSIYVSNGIAIEIGQSELKGEIKALGFKVEGIDKRLEKVENEQSVLVKSVSDLQGFRGLILPLIVGGISAGIGAIITVSIRFSLLSGNP